MRRLFLDIETSPNIVLVWRTGAKNFVHYDNIIRERAVICAAWQWEGEEKVHTLNWDARRNDKRMLAKILPIIASADEVIVQNGERFDLPWIRTRALFHKLPPLPVVKVVDTLKWARKFYYFNSNKLDYLGKFLGVGGKDEEFHGRENPWRKVLLDNDRDELAKMVHYCGRDIGLLKQVWKRMAVACPVASHAGVFGGKEKWTCPRCASEKVYQNQRRVTARGTEQFSMRCKKCFGHFTISKQARDKWLDERIIKEAA